MLRRSAQGRWLSLVSRDDMFTDKCVVDDDDDAWLFFSAFIVGVVVGAGDPWSE